MTSTDCTCCTSGLGSYRRQGAASFTLMLAFVGGPARAAALSEVP
jgi:hypothetical protein